MFHGGKTGCSKYQVRFIAYGAGLIVSEGSDVPLEAGFTPPEEELLFLGSGPSANSLHTYTLPTDCSVENGPD